jgi:hypothetical protein
MRCSFIKPLALACLACGAATARADALDFTGFANGYQTVNFAVQSSQGNTAGFTAAGGFSASLNGGASFTTYCIDLYEYIRFSDAAYTNYQLVDGSLHAFANAQADADIGKLFTYAASAVTTAVGQSAFQIAVWELAYETSGSYHVGTGNATFFGGTAATSGALAQANRWLSALGSVTSDVNVWALDSKRLGANIGYQDQVFAAPVPEPTTYALMVAGLVSVGAMARRRQRLPS